MFELSLEADKVKEKTLLPGFLPVARVRRVWSRWLESVELQSLFSSITYQGKVSCWVRKRTECYHWAELEQNSASGICCYGNTLWVGKSLLGA